MNPVNQCENNFDSYPSWICRQCAYKNGGKSAHGHVFSLSPGVCGWCEQQKVVTQPRDYGYPIYQDELVKTYQNIWEAALDHKHDKSENSER